MISAPIFLFSNFLKKCILDRKYSLSLEQQTRTSIMAFLSLKLKSHTLSKLSLKNAASATKVVRGWSQVISTRVHILRVEIGWMFLWSKNSSSESLEDMQSRSRLWIREWRSLSSWKCCNHCIIYPLTWDTLSVDKCARLMVCSSPLSLLLLLESFSSFAFVGAFEFYL